MEKKLIYQQILKIIKVKPIYKTFKGWKTTNGISKFENLPECKNIYKRLEKFVETKVSSISTSPERRDTILVIDPFLLLTGNKFLI